MKTKLSGKVQQFKFEDSKQQLYSLIAGHLFLLTIFLMYGVFPIDENPRFVFCLLVILPMFVLLKSYDWKSRGVNLSILIVYLGLIFMELLLLGLPIQLVEPKSDTLSKRNLLEPIVAALPLFYMGIRFFLVIPLVAMVMNTPPKSRRK